MIKNLTVSYMLAVTLMQGVGPAFAGVAPAPTSIVASASARTVLAPVAQVRQEQAATGRLSAGEMEAVRGDGIFSWVTKWIKTITRWIAILGAIRSILQALQTIFGQQPSAVAGGDTQQRSETVTENYNSEADYNAGIMASENTQVTSDWQQTEVWYGESCGGTDGGQDQMYMQDQMSSC